MANLNMAPAMAAVAKAVSPIPERLINYMVYDEANVLLGCANVELPKFEAMTDTISGAGIAGELDTPTLGHFGPMGLNITWRTITSPAVGLLAPTERLLTIRGSQQYYDSAKGVTLPQAVKVATKVKPKVLDLGSFEPGASTDSGSEFEVSYIKIWINNVPRIELDKYNFKFIVDGIDYLAKVRSDLGLI